MTTTNDYRQPRNLNVRLASTTNQQTEPQSSPTPTYRSIAMSNVPQASTSNTGGWIMFTYIQFALALGMAGLSIVFMPNVDFQTKSFLMMAMIFTVGATFTLAKTIRDEHENKKLVSRIEDARTEKLLMEVGR